MQTPTSRNNSLEAPRKISPQTVSTEVRQRISSPAVSSEVLQKPRVVRQLKTASLESNSVSSYQANNKVKDRSTKITERRSPQSPLSEKKRPSRVSELESQISQLQEDLKKARDQLNLAESWKKQAQQDAEESKKQLLHLSRKFEESQQQLLELSYSSSKEDHLIEHQKVSQDEDQERQSKIRSIERHGSVGSAALATAMDEINRLEVQLVDVAEYEATQNKCMELAHAGLHNFKENLSATHLLLKNLKNQVRNLKETETGTQILIEENLLQLETAKKIIEALSLDNGKNMEGSNLIASKAGINLLELIVKKLEADNGNGSNSDIENIAAEEKFRRESGESEIVFKSIEGELVSTKFELEQLKLALETAEIRFHEEQVLSTVQIGSAYELMELIKSAASQREAELEEELKKSNADIEELKANLMDKETELQGICEENECLNVKLERSLSGQRENELEKELKILNEIVENLWANLMDKETELQNILEENGLPKIERKKKDLKKGKVDDEAMIELKAARASEQEALLKLGHVTEEADKTTGKATRVAEELEAVRAANSELEAVRAANSELEAVRAANSELEAELRKLKVQSDQWRKAAEAAAAMLSAGNNEKLMGITGSMGSNNSSVTGKGNLPYLDDMDDDLLKKKNGNMLKRIGVLWKKPTKMSTP